MIKFTPKLSVRVERVEALGVISGHPSTGSRRTGKGCVQ